jgi:cupin 2 domain-containing protein
MAQNAQNIFADIPASGSAEEFLTLLENSATHIGRIVSHGQASPEGFWYDQTSDEWVMLLRGSAALEFADGKVIELQTGDHLTIARHVKHRVARTSHDAVWLAVHLR